MNKLDAFLSREGALCVAAVFAFDVRQLIDREAKGFC